MIAQQVAKKYATALFLSVGPRGLIDEAYAQFGELWATLSYDASLLKFLSSPRIEEEDKLQLLQRVFGSRMNRHLLEFMGVLVRKRRAMYLGDVIEEFGHLVEIYRGIARATVVAAVPLSDDEEKRLIATLVAKTGKNIQLDKKIDASLIGGMIVQIDDEIIDGSVKHGLNQLEEQLNHIKVY
jgi:F-type H+-transporting ATPase subunit delta